ncbi:sugar ABC transporter [Burkholderia sp. Ax-1719]|uniref:sugar ABC transporter n=1 Tax=Burkholderia sp. Ax-1719 TaxID=2608334 RepID=UPI0014246D5F|nr:sugar ABC transporter [Burkholderia sp. Ax-1719]NIE62767.1 sugar ABC transporter [Burkholderia sp. Ax-1719]
MIYTVECSFADPHSEAEWNDFYSVEKLRALISVTGFYSSQRFRALNDDCPAYLAIHTIEGIDVLMGEEYRQKGGGNFSKWQQHITDWHRNLYSAIGMAPAVNADELLVLCASGPELLVQMDLLPLAMHAVALEKSPEHRWLAKVKREDAHRFRPISKELHFYSPITGQLTSSRTVATGQMKVCDA